MRDEFIELRGGERVPETRHAEAACLTERANRRLLICRCISENAFQADVRLKLAVLSPTSQVAHATLLLEPSFSRGTADGRLLVL